MIVRLIPAGLAHVPQVTTLHKACFDDPWSQRSIAEVLAAPGAFAYLAMLPSASLFSTGEVSCGFAIARVAEDEAELLSIGVAPEWRRRGLARRLIDEVLARAASRGVRSIFLEVAEDNHGAQALYAGYGFEPIGRRKDYYRRPEGAVAAVTMRRPVRSGSAAWSTGRP